jgi:hypothetical protein
MLNALNKCKLNMCELNTTYENLRERQTWDGTLTEKLDILTALITSIGFIIVISKNPYVFQLLFLCLV